MDYKFLITGLRNILINPTNYWESIHYNNTPMKLIRNSFLLPLILLVSVAVTTGSLVFINTELSFIYSILLGVRSFVVLYITVYLTTYMLGEITYPLDLGKDFNISFRLIVFSLTPFLLCQVVSSIFESLLFINLIGLYGLYIFWAGAEVMLKPPQHKRIPMIVAITIVLIAIYFASDLMLSIVTDRIYYSYFAR